MVKKNSMPVIANKNFLAPLEVAPLLASASKASKLPETPKKDEKGEKDEKNILKVAPLLTSASKTSKSPETPKKDEGEPIIENLPSNFVLPSHDKIILDITESQFVEPTTDIHIEPINAKVDVVPLEETNNIKNNTKGLLSGQQAIFVNFLNENKFSGSATVDIDLKKIYKNKEYIVYCINKKKINGKQQCTLVKTNLKVTDNQLLTIKFLSNKYADFILVPKTPENLKNCKNIETQINRSLIS